MLDFTSEIEEWKKGKHAITYFVASIMTFVSLLEFILWSDANESWKLLSLFYKVCQVLFMISLISFSALIDLKT